MTFYVFGNECDVVLPSDSLTYETTAAGVGAYGTIRDAVFTRTAISQTYGGTYGQIDAGANLTTCWFHMMHGGVIDGTSLSLHDSAQTEVFRLVNVDGGLQMYYLSAPATWTAIGDAVTVTDSIQQEYDIKVVPGASGSAELYVSGTRRTSGSAAMTQFASIRYARVRAGNGQSYSSQFIMGDEPTTTIRVLTGPATGNGATTEGVGDFSNINEAVFSDANYNTFSAANQVRLVTHSTDLAGYDILAVGVAARIKCGAAGPQNAKLALRTSGTTYPSSTTFALNNGYSNIFNSWALNPNGSVTWDETAGEGLQYGEKAIA